MSLRIVYFLLGNNPFNAVELLRGVGEAASPAGVIVEPVQSLRDLQPTPDAGLILTPRPDGLGADSGCLARWVGRVVGLFDHDWPIALPRVVPDEDAVGRAAAEHLIERGFRRLLFWGPDLPWSRLRAKGFMDFARAAKVPVEAPLTPTWQDAVDPSQLHRCIAESRRGPVGILAANDQLAALLRHAALAGKLGIPEDIGLVGVDNFEVTCAYGAIPISSVDLGSRRIGREAALRLLRGALHPDETTRVAPAGVVARRSTDPRIVDDPEVVEALRLIRDGWREAITPHKIADRLAMSRATLDRRMLRAIGRTCTEQLRHVRLISARQLVESTGLPLSEVAATCGFHYLSHFSHAFKRSFGVSPMIWRQRHSGAFGSAPSGIA